MAYKTLVLDLDGTLTNSEKKVSKKTKSAIMNIQEMGIRVILASGRSDYGMNHIAKELELAKYKNYMISFNGSRIRDLYNNNCYMSKILTLHCIRRFLSCGENMVSIF